jgi:hypothetical protein
MHESFGPHGGPQRPTQPPTGEARSPDVPQDGLQDGLQERPRVNWWLRHTSSGWDRPYFSSLVARERARRSRLASWLILGLLVGVAILSPLALEDARARLTIAIWVVGLLGAATLNRRGLVSLAGLVLVALFSGGLLLANLASPIGLTLGELPNFDAYVVPVVLAATLLPRSATFPVAALNSALIVGNYLLQPHNANIEQDAHLYSSSMVQTVSFLVRPIALQFVIAVVAYLWVRGTDEALRRADRAEEIAFLEQREVARAYAEMERIRALEEGVRYLHQTLAAWAAGDIRRRVPRMPVAILARVGDDLNTFIERFAGSMQASALLRRVWEEAGRLADAIYAWRGGQAPIWPAPGGTPLDPVILALVGDPPSGRGHRPSEGSGPGGPRLGGSRPGERDGGSDDRTHRPSG